MSTKKYFIEVYVTVANALVIKREPAKDWNDALSLATTMAVQMFPEDPMAGRVFRSGIYVYSNRNDLGDTVVIRPIVEELVTG